jgi:hypothetical protein
MFDYIFTPLGKGKIVHKFKDGTLCVELEHGGGQIFYPEDLFPQKIKGVGKPTPSILEYPAKGSPYMNGVLRRAI